MAKAKRRRATGTVRISLPASVTYSPKLLKRSFAQLAEQIGHPKCFSGADCLFQMEREFLFDADRISGRAAHVNAVAEPVNVVMAPGVKYDLGQVEKAIDRVIDKIGAHPCISGADVLFRDEMIFVNEELEATQFG